jgi:hypothetical protein
VQHFARVLVTPSQATSLLTAGASGLRAVKEGSGGAYVKVLLPEETPLCALDGDRVTQISGGPVQVRPQAMHWVIRYDWEQIFMGAGSC